ncbi:mycothiol conjugate amidase Mca [Gulosibacter sediminis]|uniref:mycothiol conjugate amidase Mca n=1 Tax=Gulosibacter sediminis TaxID=1729695 RepID=UPI0018660C1C|nr:mycothiol conjugate amidase Mca [Gulosibacter sediminis]
MSLRLLAVHAHPDDESSKGAATYASYVHDGAEVMIVSCTGGEAGSILNTAVHARSHAERDLPGLRRLEMAEAQRVLGVEHRWLGYRDSGMPEDGVLEPGTFARIPLEVSVRPLLRLIREFRPHVLVTYDENGGYPHPDHIRTHEVSMLAWQLAGEQRYPELGEPWAPSKLYYDRTMNQRRAQSMADLIKDHPEVHLTERMEAMLERLMSVEANLTTQISIERHFEVRDAALRAHASQVGPEDEFFFGYPRDLEREAYPYDDYELVASRVACELPETDLFNGIDAEAESK